MPTPLRLLSAEPDRPRARVILRWWLVLAMWLAALGLAAPALQAAELVRLEAQRTDQGVLLSFDTTFDLPPGVEQALQKGVALYFVADARIIRSRWYWFDRPQAEARRVWRLTYQPLTFNYRVSLGGLAQTYASLPEALRALQRGLRWRIAEPAAIDDDGNYSVEFQYRLDAERLPRPLQIGIGGKPEWNLHLERTIALPSER